MAIKGIKDAGFMAFQKTSAVSRSVVAVIGGFQAGEINRAESGDALKDARNSVEYDLVFFDPHGEVITAAGNISKKKLASIPLKEIEKTMQDGGPRAINVVSGGIIPAKFMLAGVKNNRGKISGVVALDYTKDYVVFLKYGVFYAAGALFSVLAVLAVIWVFWHFLNLAVLKPVGDIKEVIEKMAEGDLSAGMVINSYDEMGQLAYSFDKMRERLKETFEQLKSEIRERYAAEKALQVLHLKLTSWVSELDKRTHEITILNQMGKMLRSCKSMEEFHSFTRRYCEQLFPEDRGAVYLFNDSGKFLEAASMWGKKNIEKSFAPEACWAIRDGFIYSVEDRKSVV